MSDERGVSPSKKDRARFTTLTPTVVDGRRLSQGTMARQLRHHSKEMRACPSDHTVSSAPPAR